MTNPSLDGAAPPLNGAGALAKLLRAAEAGPVFGIASGKLMPLLRVLSNEPALPFVGLRHEASGAIMAAAHFAATGQIATALGEMGPGSLNLAAGAGVANSNHLAALFITTNQHRAASYPARGMFMDMDTRAVFAPLTKWSAVVPDGRRLPEMLHRALRTALTGRPGPVHLDIPQDVLAGPYAGDIDALSLAPARYRSLYAPRPSTEGVQAAVSLLSQSRRPLIVAGGGVPAAGAEAALLTLAQRLRAPVMPTQMALGVVPTDSPHHIGHGGLISGDACRLAFEQADLVLSIGCRWSSWLWDQAGPLARPSHRHIAINIDPLALGEPAWHDVALQADARHAIDDLLAALADAALDVDPAWLSSMRDARRAYLGRLDALASAPSEGQPMHPAALALAIGKALPTEALAVYDGGHTTFWSNDLTPVHAARTRFHDPGVCQLGFGLPYALALQRAFPSRPVFNITGDGSFGFTVQELDTARRHGLPVITLIHNNGAWGVIRHGQRQQGFEYASELQGTDYAAIARGFGCHGETVHHASDIAPAIERARASGLPAVIDCLTRFEPHPCMPAFGSMNRFGQPA